LAPLDSLTWQVHVYGEAQPRLTQACSEIGLPLHLFAWLPAMRRAGFRRDALYLVRPDGYVALADPRADSTRLRNYFNANNGWVRENGIFGKCTRIE
jgi:hypothetical protein